MSALLDSVLDSTRRAEIAAADRLVAHFPPARYKATARAEPREVPQHCYDYATDLILGDLDTFTDFLDTFGVNSITSEHEARVPGRLAQAKNATVLHAAIVAATRNDATGCLEAMKLLVDRYIKDNSERIHQIASEAA